MEKNTYGMADLGSKVLWLLYLSLCMLYSKQERHFTSLFNYPKKSLFVKKSIMTRAMGVKKNMVQQLKYVWNRV